MGDRARSSCACSTASGSGTTRAATRCWPRECRPGTGSTAEWPTCRLEASGEAVGLPAGQMGNSEVGHLNLGAGFPVLQDLPRISQAIADGSFFDNAVLREAVDHARRDGSRLHLLGLIGPGGIHAVDEHIEAMVELAHARGPAGRPRAAPRLHRWARHAAALGRGAAARAGGALGRPRHDRHRVGPLLRHGPRPALGADGARLGGDRPRRGTDVAVGDGRRRRRARRGARATSSSCRPSSTATPAWATATPSST